ncbi:DUF3027 domain-containing protein [Demequina sp. SYSU T00039]|uniref:DUF3027 domain-containing protein n=1 Tax=Demequina lignilytica TaxID=3051663 RepID=A0AAW7M3M2_9MICO|nr:MULTISPECIES: DUF3027 domain-containing protein [unclassified Demequina]MDN4477507.1 DUF3027 domain-containing protein [Demequina sp. SYSU T00039-1]MDN4488142.1 DUF3027 domain-containing protein [Demequina sp. SYSU T00039]MDN4490583.1 DUF3027 domain-containing protein [Demequina sp. SYSU T00068]
MAKDAVLIGAVDLAREAAIEAAGDVDAVGEHLSATTESERLVTHLFACALPGYRGWVWSVSLARAPRQKAATVCEAHLVPADDALLAPAWVPWADRVRPGDLEPSMVLPYIPDDARLVPGYEVSGEDEDAMEIWELGLGRARALGSEGRSEVADRWYRGSHGPNAASAIASASPCSTCAFFIPLTGSMRLRFGACSNEWSPSDGKVVSVDHGCGAHSETDVERHSTQWPDPDPVFENQTAVTVDLEEAEEEPEPEPTPEPEQPADEAAEEPTEPADEASEPETPDDEPVAPEPVEVDGDVVETEVAPGEPLPEDAAAETTEASEEPAEATDAATASEPEQRS